MSFFSKDFESLTSKIDPDKEYPPNFTLDLALEIPLPLSRKRTPGYIQTSSQAQSQGYSQGQKVLDTSSQPDLNTRSGFHGTSQNASSQPEMAFNFDTMRKPAFLPAALIPPRAPFTHSTFNQFSQPSVTISRPQAMYIQPRPGGFIRPVGIHRPQTSYLEHQATFTRPPASYFQPAAPLRHRQVLSQSSFFTRPMVSNSQPTAKYERPAWVSKEVEKPKPRGPPPHKPNAGEYARKFQIEIEARSEKAAAGVLANRMKENKLFGLQGLAKLKKIASKNESLNVEAIKAKIIERIRTNGDQEQLALAKLTEMLINCGSQTSEDEKVRSALLELRDLALKSCSEPSVVNKHGELFSKLDKVIAKAVSNQRAMMACLKTNFDDWFDETMTKVRKLRSDVSDDKEEIKSSEYKFHEKLNNIERHKQDVNERNVSTAKMLKSTFDGNITDFCDVTSSPPIRKRIGPQPRRCVALKQHQAKVVGKDVEPKKVSTNPESSQALRKGVKQALIDDTDYYFTSEKISRPDLDESKDCATYSQITNCLAETTCEFPSGNLVRPELIEQTHNNVIKRKLIHDSFYFFPSGQIVGLDEPIDYSLKRSKVTEKSSCSGNAIGTKLDCSLPVKRKLIDDSFYFFPSGDIIGQVEPTHIGSDLVEKVKPKVFSVPTSTRKSTKRSQPSTNVIKRNLRSVPARKVITRKQSDYYDDFYSQVLD